MVAATKKGHHRHQHAERAQRRHGRHDHGADAGCSAAAGRRRQRAERRRQMGRLVADLDARPPHLGQAPRHRRHGPHRHRRRPPRQGVRPVDPLSQPPPRRPLDRGRAGGDLLGEPRPDACPHGHHLGQLPVDAGDLPSLVGAAAGADAAVGLHRQHGARRHHRRGYADPA